MTEIFIALLITGVLFISDPERLQRVLELVDDDAVVVFMLGHDRGMDPVWLTLLASATTVAGYLQIAWLLLGIVLFSVDRNFGLVPFLASHAVFASFLIGALMPRGRLTTALSRRIGTAAPARC